MKDQKIVRKKINNEEDFIYSPRLGNSLTKLMEKNPDGVPDDRIQKVLLVSEKELKKYYNSAIEKLRKVLIKKS